MMKPTLPSLKQYFLVPFKKDTSPYGVAVCESINDYLNNSCDKELMDLYLISVTIELAVILKRQRGNQHGFGDDANSPENVLRNMTSELLDEPAATHTKSIENYFGRLDGLLKVCSLHSKRLPKVSG